MQIGYVMMTERGEADALLTQVAARLMQRGVRLAGLVQTNQPRPNTHHCDMDVRVLPEGPVLRISQNLGAATRGCRLDPAALEDAVGHIDAALDAAPHCLILNKFGKHEAEGRGLRPVIAKALLMDIPVVVGVNALNREAFAAFADGYAQPLAATRDTVEHWVMERIGQMAEA